jgi:predicted transcriptional regulator
MKPKVPAEIQPHFAVVLQNEKELKKLVNYKESDDAYLLVLGRDGNIAWQSHGAFSDNLYTEVKNHVQSLMQ